MNTSGHTPVLAIKRVWSYNMHLTDVFDVVWVSPHTHIIKGLSESFMEIILQDDKIEISYIAGKC
jgi:hypothetical protein